MDLRSYICDMCIYYVICIYVCIYIVYTLVGDNRKRGEIGWCRLESDCYEALPHPIISLLLQHETTLVSMLRLSHTMPPHYALQSPKHTYQPQKERKRKEDQFLHMNAT